MNNSGFKKVITFAVVVAIIIGGGYLALKALFPETDEVSGPTYTTAVAEIGDINVGVDAVGNLQAGYGGSIRIPYSSGYYGVDVNYEVQEILVQSGDVVETGQVLVRLSPDELQAQLDDALDDLAVERASLAALLNISESEVEYANADNGITMFAPFDGKITSLSAVVGTEVSSGSLVCKVVDDSEMQITATLTASEIQQIQDGTTKAVYRLGGNTYFGEAIITDINRNPVPVPNAELNVDGGIGVVGDSDSYTFVYYVTLKADNPGLVVPGMNISIGFFEADEDYVFDKNVVPEGIRWSRYVGSIDKFTKEQNVISTADGLVTEVLVKSNETVAAGDPILIIAGQGVREEIERRISNYEIKKEIVEALQAKFANLTVTAPSSGMVSEISTSVGASVSEGEWLGSIFSYSEMNMEVMIDDIDIVNVRVGAPVTITLDALPEQEFEGTVQYVSGMGDSSRYAVYLTLTGSNDMREGMQARAYIDSGSASDVIIIPAEAVYKEEGIYKVEVIADGVVSVRNIVIGLSNDRYVEVMSGLEAGEVVVTGSTLDLLPSKSTGSDSTLLPTGGSSDSDSGSSTEPSIPEVNFETEAL